MREEVEEACADSSIAGVSEEVQEVGVDSPAAGVSMEVKEVDDGSSPHRAKLLAKTHTEQRITGSKKGACLMAG